MTIVASVLAASLSGVEARPVCRQIVLRGAVRAGDTFSRTLGGGLELRLTPTRFSDPATPAPLDGWRIEVVPVRLTGAPSGLEDRIYPVNLPLRFNPNQDIGTSYGISAKQKLQDPIDYAFVPDEQASVQFGTVRPMRFGHTRRETPRALQRIISKRWTR